MMPLCEALEINVNGLLTGERLTDAEYKSKAEATIMDLIKENKENKKKLLQSIVCGITAIIAVLALIVIAAYIEMPVIVRILLIVLSVLLTAVGIGTAVSMDINTGYFECPSCKKLFVPTMKEYINGVHTLTKRRLKCPECGETSMCKHRIVR